MSRELIERFLKSWEIPANPEQLDLIYQVHEPSDQVVVGEAVPGSGKTTMLVAAIYYLLRSMKVRADEILSCTFNTDCADVTRQRLATFSATNPMAYRKLSRTCHSVGWEICRELGYKELIVNQEEILEQTMRLFEGKNGDCLGMGMKEFRARLSFARNRGCFVMPNGVDTMIDSATVEELDMDIAHISDMLLIYEKVKGNMVDFDDQLAIPAKLYRLWKNGLYPKSPFELFKKLKFLFLDELQDFNACQMLMIEGIREISGCKVIGVGDRDQCVIEGTMIAMGNGRSCPVEEVRQGDLVRSSVDGISEFWDHLVTDVFKKQYKGPIVCIHTENSILSTTPEHRHFVSRAIPPSPCLIFRQCGDEIGGGQSRCHIDLFTQGMDNELRDTVMADVTRYLMEDTPFATETHSNCVDGEYDIDTCHHDEKVVNNIYQRIRSIVPDHIPSFQCFGRRRRNMSVVCARDIRVGDEVLSSNGEFVMVQMITNMEYDGYIYDLNVHTAHNYVANGIVTHNSIYGWRGANAHNIEAFTKRFNGIVMAIPRNYRSGPAILKAASAIIQRNHGRSNYEIVAGRTDIEGQAIQVECSGPHSEMKALVEIVQSVSAQYQPRNIFVLGRTNACLAAAARTLHMSGIAVTAKLDEFQNEHSQILNCVGAVIRHPNTNMRSALKFVKLIGEHRALRATAKGVELDDVDCEALGKGVIYTKVYRLIQTLKGLRDEYNGSDIKNDSLAFNQICYAVRDALSKFTEEYGRSTAMNMRAELDDVTQHIIDMASSIGPMDAINRLYEFEDLDISKERLNCVELMTAHKAKGLENSVVIIIDGDNFPCNKAEEGSETYYQESNLLFVAMTRAKEMLIVLRHPKKNFGGVDKDDWRTSPFYELVPWTKSFKYGGREMRDAFPSPSPDVIRSINPEPGVFKRPVAWPDSIKEFETGETWDAFKEGVIQKMEIEGMALHPCRPADGWDDPAQRGPSFGQFLTKFLDPVNGTKYLCDIYADFMSKGIKPEDKRYKLNNSWLKAAGIKLAKLLGPGWIPAIFQRRDWIKYPIVQKDFLLRLEVGTSVT